MHRREIRALLSAMTLGDGGFGLKYNPHRIGQNKLDLTSVGIAFHCSHAIGQEDYARWKIQQIDDIFKQKKISRQCSVNIYKRETPKQDVIQFTLQWTKYFRYIYKKIYRFDHKENKYKKAVKWLLDQIYEDKHLFIWFADDGGEMSQPSYKLHINSFTFGEAEIIKQWFTGKYKVTPKIAYQVGSTGNRTPYLKFSTKDSKIIWGHIREYVLKFESMKYKFRYSIAKYEPFEIEDTPFMGDDIVPTKSIDLDDM